MKDSVKDNEGLVKRITGILRSDSFNNVASPLSPVEGIKILKDTVSYGNELSSSSLRIYFN